MGKPLEVSAPGSVIADIMRRFTIQLLLALDYAHYLGIIHTGNSPFFNYLYHDSNIS